MRFHTVAVDGVFKKNREHSSHEEPENNIGLHVPLRCYRILASGSLNLLQNLNVTLAYLHRFKSQLGRMLSWCQLHLLVAWISKGKRTKVLIL